ncbi:MAG: nitrogen fixation protein NifQ [Desulfuromonadales bacterium]|nr:nitrogen fixation protein NifQ [Desulfuromonadales bacterium]
MANYTDTIRRWATDTRRAGALPDADGIGEVGLGEGEAGRRLAVRFTLRVRDDRIETVRYQVFGCGFTIAACAAAAELAEGHALAEVVAIAPAWVEATLAGLPPDRDYCAVLAVEALQAAVKSARNSHQPVTATIAADDDHAPRVSAADPVYRLLIDSPAPPDAPAEDRHLVACLLAVAAGEPCAINAALGLNEDELADLLSFYFPAVTPASWKTSSASASADCPQANPEILDLLLSYLPRDAEGWTAATSFWLARILAARAARPGHLWLTMGLFARPELTAVIRRHLPALAAANGNGMRWKRFLFKQLCDRSGGTMCKTPDCGTCSDHALCFGGE